MFIRNRPILLALLICQAVMLTGCDRKSPSFLGVEASHNAIVLGAVANTPAMVLDQFITDWMVAWEKGDADWCYQRMHSHAKSLVSVGDLLAARTALRQTYGSPEGELFRAIHQPVLDNIKMSDALFKKTLSETFTLYNFILVKYERPRERDTLIYTAYVALEDGRLAIAAFGIQTERAVSQSGNDRTLFWLGTPELELDLIAG